MVEVYLLKNHTPEETLYLLSPYLLLEEREHIQRYRNLQDRSNSLLGMLAIKYLLENKDLGSSPIFREATGKPYVKLPGWKGGISISHSGKTVACAITSNGAVGVDIEEFHEIDVNVAKEILSHQELKAFQKLHTLKDQHTFIFKQWTLKEAYLKATGMGLQNTLLSDIEFTTSGQPKLIAEESWSFFSSMMNVSLYLSLCYACQMSQEIQPKIMTVQELESHFSQS
ncbi:4'-phosphopantetheinyl transferase family protein [Bacillus sp. FJAT-52991]|uniref:4'-phosphopantetheinyl transferase superfamily protein n=1 Tax=Bacillus kandeliae TaxID=3129297 RepID=A0ABZ2N5V2_9BACI